MIVAQRVGFNRDEALTIGKAVTGQPYTVKAPGWASMSRPPKQLASDAFKLYIQFRSEVAAGKKGWGANGTLSLSLIREMANFPK